MPLTTRQTISTKNSLRDSQTVTKSKQSFLKLREKEETSTKEQSSSPPDDTSRISKLEEIKKSMKERRTKKFDIALGKETLNLEELRSLAWNGIPSCKSSE